MAIQKQREGFVSDEPQKPAAAVERPVVDMSGAPIEPAEKPESWPLKVPLLHRAINDGRGEIKELVFREPTAADINRYGNPVRIDGNGDILIDDRKMLFIMTALSGVMTPFLEKMHPRDYNSCAYRLRGFFLPDPAAWMT